MLLQRRAIRRAHETCSANLTDKSQCLLSSLLLIHASLLRILGLLLVSEIVKDSEKLEELQKKEDFLTVHAQFLTETET